MKKVKTTINSISYEGRSPYLDSLKARTQCEKAVKVLDNSFSIVEKIGRKQLYKVNNSFYVLIVSAPSALKLDTSIRGLMKQYGKLPFYVLFTRETGDYPQASFPTYYTKIRTIYKLKGGFSGCILGLSELKNDEIIDDMSNVVKLPLGLKRFKASGGKFDLDAVLREMGLSSKKIQIAKELIKLVG